MNSDFPLIDVPNDQMNNRKQDCPPGLYLVATPIGSARDITLRALDVLAKADVIAAEDTRSAQRLMSIHGLSLSGRRLMSYHDHNGDEQRPALLRMLKDNKSVCLLSEAGSPLIADPGWKLAHEVRQVGLPVHVVPGASSVIAALQISGMPSDKFMFVGFLPSQAGPRSSLLAELVEIQATLICFETSRRLTKTLADIRDIMGAAREVAVCREITKKFEEVWQGSVEEILARATASPVKGEIVILIKKAARKDISMESIATDLREALSVMSIRDAAKTVAQMHSIKQRDVYQLALTITKKSPSSQ